MPTAIRPIEAILNGSRVKALAGLAPVMTSPLNWAPEKTHSLSRRNVGYRRLR